MATNQPVPFDPSSFTAIGAEDLDAIAQIQAGLVDHYQPANSEEIFAIERIALARHSLLRAYRMESGLVTFGMQKAFQIPGVPQILSDPEGTHEPHVATGQKSSFWMAAGFCEANRTSLWQFFLRYQAQTERFYRHAIGDFERLRRHSARSPEQTTDPAPKKPPASEPTPKQPVVDPPRVPVPTQPAAIVSHPPRRNSHRRQPVRVTR